jgi:hypothetical protein
MNQTIHHSFSLVNAPKVRGFANCNVFPHSTAIVSQVWDPLSATQTLRLVRLVKRLTDDYPTVSGQSKHFQTLLKAVVERMKWTLENDVYVPIYAQP